MKLCTSSKRHLKSKQTKHKAQLIKATIFAPELEVKHRSCPVISKKWLDTSQKCVEVNPHQIQVSIMNRIEKVRIKFVKKKQFLRANISGIDAKFF